MQTKDVIKLANIDRETLRFYEARGLLPAIKKDTSGYRVFSKDTIKRIEFIKTAKEAGFSLNEIKDLIQLKLKKATCRQGRDLAIEKQNELKAKMKALRKMTKILSSFVESCEANGEEGLSKVCHMSFDTI